MPSFRSSSYRTATSETNFEKQKGTSNYMILVPLIDLKSLTRVCSRLVPGSQIGGARAVNLKFLPVLWRVHRRNFKFINRTRIIKLLEPVLN